MTNREIGGGVGGQLPWRGRSHPRCPSRNWWCTKGRRSLRGRWGGRRKAFSSDVARDGLERLHARGGSTSRMRLGV